MRSAKQHLFSQIPKVNIRRSVFNRSSTYKTTFNAGLLIPFFLDEYLPGDTFTLDLNFFCRLATPIVPFMDNLYLDYWFFSCPNRLVWEHWENFMGQQDNPGDSTDYLVPTFSCTNPSVASVWDYFGLPMNVGQKLTVNALPFRAYYRIYNEWFRDENLIDSILWGLTRGDGPDDSVDQFAANGAWPCHRGKRHDYFTSALPWPQKGPAVDLPLVGDAPVYVNTVSHGSSGETTVRRDQWFLGQGSDNNDYLGFHGDYDLVPADGAPNVFADLSSVSGATINSLRQAFQLQKFYEQLARGGSRYTEFIRSMFGVVSPDARLQRTEYLGGGSQRIVIKPVEQNSSTDSISPQGNLAAYGLAGHGKHVFTKSFTEHGYIIGILEVRADLTYQQGINRIWSRETREDFYLPVFAHLGEQAILNKEIYAQGTAADNEVFGYQERYAEYRYKPSLITGQFRSSVDQSLDVWHLAQDFESLPTLSQVFIEDTPPVNRVVAVQDQPQFLFDSLINLKCVRPMPVYSVPGLVDHF